MSINSIFILKKSIPHLFLSMCLLLLNNLFDISNNYVLLTIYSLSSLLLYCRFLRTEWGSCSLLNMEMLYLAGCMLRFVIPAFSVVYILYTNHKVEYIENDITDYLLPTIVWMNIFHIFFYVSFKSVSNRISFIEPLQKYVLRYNIFNFLILIYLLLLPLRALTTFTILKLLPSSITTIINGFGDIIILLMALISAFERNSRKTKKFFLVCFIEFIYAAVFTYYKTHMMMPLIYIMLYIIIKSRLSNSKLLTRGNLIRFTIICGVVVYFIFPFMTAKRIVSGYSLELNMATKHFTPTDIFEHFNDYAEDDNSVGFFDRQDALPVNAFFYKDVCKNHTYHSELLRKNILISIPKLIYKDKPINDVGLMATEYVTRGAFDVSETNNCSTYVGLFGGAYFWGGIVAVLFCSFVCGLSYSFYHNFLIAHFHNPISLLFYLAFLMTAIQSFEETYDGGIGRIISYLPIVFLIIVSSFFLKIVKR